MILKTMNWWEREDGFAATTTAIILGVASLAGAAVGAVGSYSSAQSQKEAANFNSKVAQNNAQAAQQQSAQDALQVKARTDRLRGAQSAAMAKAGVSGGGDVMYDSSIQGELDRLTTLYKGRVEGANYRSQSELYKSQASAAGTAGWLSASGSLLSGAGRSLYTYSAIRNNQPDFGY